LGVASVLKLFEKRFNLIVEQALGRPVIRLAGYHIVSPCLVLQSGEADMIMPGFVAKIGLGRMKKSWGETESGL
jgi:hypothetical protein